MGVSENGVPGLAKLFYNYANQVSCDLRIVFRYIYSWI